MNIEHEMQTQHVAFVLPVTLAPSARRAVLLETGVAPTPEQALVINRLTDLSPELRERVVDVWEKISVDFDAEKVFTVTGPKLGRVRHARNLGYLSLQCGANDDHWARYLPGTDGDAIDLDHVFFGVDGRTVGALEYFRTTLDPSQALAFDAMLAGAPLVSEVSGETRLCVEDVLGAYEHAIELAEQLIAAVDSGTRAPALSWIDGAHRISNEAIFLCPDYGQEQANRPAAILKTASPGGYTRARALLEQMANVPNGIVADKIDGVCFHWWSNRYAGAPDERKIEEILKTAVANARSDARAGAKEREATERYERCRAQWIEKHGSQRLKRAAARGYRHDGIYRDERLQVELPGFVGSLGRKPTIRGLVNPSESALELEAEMLARCEALGIPPEQVRLVYAQPGDEVDWAGGEFIQVEGFLGRHTVWRSVSGKKDSDDIPF